MANEKCRNCGAELSATAILAASEEAGVSSEQLQFYCSTYNAETDTCPGMSRSEYLAPAKWALN